jgi:hypothetical protein
MAKRFTAVIIIVNLLMGFLLYFSSQIVLFDFSGATVKGFNIFLIYGTPSQVGSVIIPIEWVMPNLPFYAFLILLIVNVLFIIKLLASRESK